MSWIAQELAKFKAWEGAEQAKILPALENAGKALETLVLGHLSVIAAKIGADTISAVKSAEANGQNVADVDFLKSLAKNAGIELKASFKTDGLDVLKTAAEDVGAAIVQGHLGLNPDYSKLNK